MSYDSKPGTLVYGWPAKGGGYIHAAPSAVEIESLGYDRFKQVPRPDPTGPDTAADVEVHCNESKPPQVRLDSVYCIASEASMIVLEA